MIRMLIHPPPPNTSADDEDDEDVDPSDEEDIDLASLCESDHPSLARGRFSLFNSLDIMHVFTNVDMNYHVDMDGIVGISR